MGLCSCSAAVVGYLSKAIPFQASRGTCRHEALPSDNTKSIVVFFDMQQTGHKLRVAIPDTAVFSGGVLRAWLCTNSKTGVLQSVPRCQHSIASLQDKLKAPHVAYEAANPDGWVAVAHFSDGLSWLVDAAGLDELVSTIVSCTFVSHVFCSFQQTMQCDLVHIWPQQRPCNFHTSGPCAHALQHSTSLTILSNQQA